MDNLSNIGTIKDILNRHGFAFSKSLGQNFLINPSVCPRIAEEGNARKGFGIIEIGTGIGVLTAELAKRADKDGRTAQPLGPSPAPGCDEPTSRCQTTPSI